MTIDELLTKYRALDSKVDCGKAFERLMKNFLLSKKMNDWATERGEPRYILDLILSSITVSLKTLDIVENLPKIEF